MEQHNTQDYSTHARKHTYQGEERQREGDRGRKWTASTCWRFCIIIVIEWVEGWGGQGSYNGCACNWTTRHVVSNFSTWNWPKHITHTHAHSIFGGGGDLMLFSALFSNWLFLCSLASSMAFVHFALACNTLCIFWCDIYAFVLYVPSYLLCRSNAI